MDTASARGAIGERLVFLDYFRELADLRPARESHSYPLDADLSKKAAKAPIHMVSAFAARQRLVLGQIKAADKSSEIVANSQVPREMVIEGATVTIDAMGCQRDIAEILEKKADYVSPSKAIKGLCAQMSRASLRAESQRLQGYQDQPASFFPPPA